MRHLGEQSAVWRVTGATVFVAAYARGMSVEGLNGNVIFCPLVGQRTKGLAGARRLTLRLSSRWLPAKRENIQSKYR